jgi:hypothetical protein
MDTVIDFVFEHNRGTPFSINEPFYKPWPAAVTTVTITTQNTNNQ